MPDDVTVSQVVNPDPVAPLGTQPGGTPAPVDPPADPPPAATTPQRSESKTVVVPTQAMKRIKEEEYTRGKQAALDELSSGAGFGSSQELVAALQKLKGQPAPAAQTAPVAQPPQTDPNEDPAAVLASGKEDRREAGKFQRQLEKVLNERNKFAQSATQWQSKAKEAQAEVDAVRAEMHLRTIASGCGVQDIDYAITLFSREVDRLTPEQAQTFDEKAYFESLRKSKPLLFGEAVVPANTGTTPGGPRAPAPGAVAAKNGVDGKVDARKLTPQQYSAELAKRGINPHAT